MSSEAPEGGPGKGHGKKWGHPDFQGPRFGPQWQEFQNKKRSDPEWQARRKEKLADPEWQAKHELRKKKIEEWRQKKKDDPEYQAYLEKKKSDPEWVALKESQQKLKQEYLEKKKSDPAWQALHAEKQAKREELKKQREEWVKKFAEKQAAGGGEAGGECQCQWKGQGRPPFKKRQGGRGYGGFEKHWGQHPGGPKQPE
jgi:hypothetical protein